MHSRPGNGAFAKTSRKADFARGFGGGTALNKQTVATRSLLAGTVVEVSDANSPWKGGQSCIRREAVIA